MSHRFHPCHFCFSQMHYDTDYNGGFTFGRYYCSNCQSNDVFKVYFMININTKEVTSTHFQVFYNNILYELIESNNKHIQIFASKDLANYPKHKKILLTDFDNLNLTPKNVRTKLIKIVNLSAFV